MSIDQAVQRGMIRERFYYSLGHPRTMSVDSIDYTSMFYGEIDEEVAAMNNIIVGANEKNYHLKNLLLEIKKDRISVTLHKVSLMY